MMEKYIHGRRSFLKKAVATTGVTGSVLTSAEPVAAANQTIRVRGDSDGDYAIRVNDSSAYGGDDLESDDVVENYSDSSWLEGTVTDGDEDTFHFNGQIRAIDVQGNISITVENPSGQNIWGNLTVSGTDTAYSVTVTDDIEKERDCEPEDEITSNGTIAQGTLDGVDEDVYDVTGTIRRISVLPGSSVVFNHDI